MAKINRIQHVVLNCSDVDASIKFYTESLGMEVVSHNQQRGMAFLSFGTEHHDIALFKYAGDGEKLEASHLGLNHIALEIEGGKDQLIELVGKLQKHNVHIDRAMDHVMSLSVYFFDPDGNRLEIFCDTMPGEAKQWLHDNGGVGKPLELEELISA